MSFRVTALWRNIGIAFMLGLATGPLAAQVPNSPIVFAQAAITTSFVPVTNFGQSAGGGDNSDAQWLRVEFHYGVTPVTPLKFVDAVEFRIWIEGRDLYSPQATTKEGLPVALTDTITYVNLAATRDAYGVFYVPPATLARYSTERGPSSFDHDFDIHIEAYVGGVKVDYFDKNKESDPNWYQQLTPVTGFVYRQDQSPFILTDADRYPPIKQPTPQQ